jgi:YD repeat-containing protein
VATSYGYDSIYQLLSATQGATTTESYAYDAVGNRTSSLGVASYTTNASNEVTANSNASFTYDSNGNQTSKTDSTGTTNYTWDYENRLKPEGSLRSFGWGTSASTASADTSTCTASAEASSAAAAAQSCLTLGENNAPIHS